MTDTLDPLGGPIRHLKRINPPWSARAVTVCGQLLIDPQDLRAALSGDDTTEEDQ